MRALIVYCHPDPSSFTASVRDVVLKKLSDTEAEVRVLDLYAVGFDPVLGTSELAEYLDVSKNSERVETHIADIKWCNSLIFVYPTWWYGLPAALKGWLDRVMLPGFAFHMPENGAGAIKPGLQHIVRLGVFTTCGASRLLTWYVGSPGKRTLTRGLRQLCSRRVRIAFAAHYCMDTSTRESREKHLTRVETTMDRFMLPPRLSLRF